MEFLICGGGWWFLVASLESLVGSGLSKTIDLIYNEFFWTIC